MLNPARWSTYQKMGNISLLVWIVLILVFSFPWECLGVAILTGGIWALARRRNL
jgi:hypothetical protein